MSPPREVRIIAVEGMPEVHAGDDLPAMILDALRKSGSELVEGDVLVVTQKIVSKAEGRIVNLDEVEPSQFAQAAALNSKKDAPYIEVVLRESRRKQTRRGDRAGPILRPARPRSARRLPIRG